MEYVYILTRRDYYAPYRPCDCEDHLIACYGNPDEAVEMLKAHYPNLTVDVTYAPEIPKVINPHDEWHPHTEFLITEQAVL